MGTQTVPNSNPRGEASRSHRYGSVQSPTRQTPRARDGSLALIVGRLILVEKESCNVTIEGKCIADQEYLIRTVRRNVVLIVSSYDGGSAKVDN